MRQPLGASQSPTLLSAQVALTCSLKFVGSVMFNIYLASESAYIHVHTNLVQLYILHDICTSELKKAQTQSALHE